MRRRGRQTDRSLVSMPRPCSDPTHGWFAFCIIVERNEFVGGDDDDDDDDDTILWLI